MMGDNQNLLREYLVLLKKKRLDANELNREYVELEGNFVRVDVILHQILQILVEDLCFYTAF